MDTTSIVKQEVESFFHLPPGSIDTKTRKREIKTARQLAQYFAYTLNGATSTEVGRQVGGQDHATILHAKRVIETAISRDHRGRIIDAEICKAVDRLRIRITARIDQAGGWMDKIPQL